MSSNNYIQLLRYLFILILGGITVFYQTIHVYAEWGYAGGYEYNIGWDGSMTLSQGGTTSYLTPDQAAAVINAYNAPSSQAALITTVNTYFDAWNSGNTSNLIQNNNILQNNIDSAGINGNYVSTTIGGITGNYQFNTVNNSTYSEPPVTTWTNNNCSNHISDWMGTWSECLIGSNAWNNQGRLTCTQTKTWNPNTVSCGSETCSSNGSCSACTGCPADAPRPAIISEDKAIILDTIHSQTILSSDPVFANNADSISIRIPISCETNDNKPIQGWGENGKITSVIDTSSQYSDQINRTGNALNFKNIPNIINISGSGTSWYFIIPEITSITPFESNNGSIGIITNGIYITIDSIDYNFLKPFIGRVSVSSDDGISWSGSVTLGTENLYKLLVNPTSTLFTTSLEQYSINNFASEIKADGTDIIVQSGSILDETRIYSTGTLFRARINTTDAAKSLNQSPGLKLDLPIISYILDGEQVSYYLSKEMDANDKTPINMSGSKFIGLKIVGGFLQGIGKNTITGQGMNSVQISTSEIRSQIQKNAYLRIRNRTPDKDKIINNIKYVEGDINIGGDQDYEILIVKNGNVSITGDLNPSRRKFGIIILNDSYSAENNTGSGNIYLYPGVRRINANIYADGGIISTNTSGHVLATDNSTRTYSLRNQLIMYGNLFTKNTIGGAILAGGKYILPGGTQLDNTDMNFNHAMIYDLNYVRRGNSGCDKNGDNDCTDNNEYEDAFIIIYDPKITQDTTGVFNIIR